MDKNQGKSNNLNIKRSNVPTVHTGFILGWCTLKIIWNCHGTCIVSEQWPEKYFHGEGHKYSSTDAGSMLS